MTSRAKHKLQAPTEKAGLSRRSILAGALVVPTAAALGVATAAPAAAYNWSRVLRQGMSGNDVRELQVRVAGWAAGSAAKVFLAVDGVFGAATHNAVRRFQASYSLGVDGIVGAQTQSRLNWLEGSGNSTRHFNYNEFGSSFSGGRVGATAVRNNVRRLMWKLEAMRRKLGDRPVQVTSGFRSVAFNNTLPGATANSQHTYGIAADVVVSSRTPQQVYNTMRTCGFSSVIRYSGHAHGDSQIEYPYGNQYWYWGHH